MNIVWNVAETHACGIVRADVPCRAINKIKGVRATVQPGVLLSDLINTDVFVSQRLLMARGESLYRSAKASGIRVVYDMDDHLLHVPEHCKEAWGYFKEPAVRKSFVDMIDAADLVSVSTDRLAYELGKISKNQMVVIKNCVDIGHADWCMKVNVQKKEGISIGWHGSSVHVGDVPLVKDAIVRVMKERKSVNLILHGHFTHDHFGGELVQFGDRVEMNGWIDHSILYAGIRMFDIGLAPLADHLFNLCKSNIKWLEYSASEVPCVATPLDPYNMCKDGEDILFARTSDEWTDCLMSLVDNEHYRRRLGLAARVRVGREYDNKTVAEDWMKAFKVVLGKKD